MGKRSEVLLSRLFWIFYLAVSAVTRKADTVVFSSAHGERFEGNPKSVYWWMRAHESLACPKLVWVANTKELQQYLTANGVEWVCARSWRGAVLAARSKAWVVDHGWYGISGGPPLWRRPLLVQLWHGFGPKPRASQSTPRAAMRKAKRTVRYWDVFVVTTVAAVPDLLALLGVPRERVKEMGYPRHDRLFRSAEAGSNAAYAAHEHDLESRSREQTVLYAPTYRTYPSAPPLDWEKVGDILARHDAHMIIHWHPYDKQRLAPPKDATRIEILEPCSGFDITEQLPTFDVLVTDFSSIAYDYAILRRPIVFYLYDCREFATAYGLNFAVPDDFPGEVCFGEKELYTALDAALAGSQGLEGRQERVLRKFFRHRDGRASERVSTWILEQIEASGTLHSDGELGAPS